MRDGPILRSAPMRRFRALALAFAAGVVAASGQAPLNLWPLALLGFSGLIALILPAATPARAARLAWLGGAGYFGAALIWIVQPFLVDIGRDGWMAPFALALISFGLALFWALAAYGAAWLRVGRGGRALALVAVLSLGELARSYVFTGFPWALIGHLWIASPVLQLAPWIGPIGLTGLALLVAALPPAFGWRGAVVSLALLGLSLGVGAWRAGLPVAGRENPPIVRLVQPNAAQTLKWRRDMIPVFLRRQLALTAAPSAQPPDLIIWPETSVAYMLDRAGPVLKQIAGAAAGAPVILGILRRDGAGTYNSAIAIDGAGTLTHLYDKHHLVPFGEYMPFGALFARLNIFGLAAGGSDGFTAGPGAQVWDMGPLGQVLPLICYEMIFPNDLRAAPRRADWILQITNDAWFGSFSGPYQHLAQARLRAAEQGLPVLRAANTGVSAVIDARGRVLQALALNKPGQLTAPIPGALPATPYVRFGDGPMAMLLLLALAGLALRRAADLR